MADTADRFLLLLTRISQCTNGEHLKTAKFLLKDRINRKQMELCDDMKDLFEKLITRNYIDKDNIELLKMLASEAFKDKQITELLQEYERPERPDGSQSSRRRQSPGSRGTETHDQLSSAEPSALTVPKRFLRVFDYTGAHLGNDWKTLARLMGLLEHEIADVELENTGLCAQSKRVMHIWYQRQTEPSTRQFKKLLRSIPRNDIADDLQENMRVK